MGVRPGVFTPGKWNAITDVPGVLVGHATIIQGDAIRTGVTAVHPHAGNPFLDRVPAAVHVGNGFGKLVGATQVDELGELETPILLTGTLSTWKVADALVEWMLAKEGMSGVRSINPLVGETNDGRLNDVRARPVTAAAVRQALESAASGPVDEGSKGAGTGCMAFGWKGGIGTSSRVLPGRLGGHAFGILLQANFDGVLQVMGAPVGSALRRHAFLDPEAGRGDGGSVMVILATDAPLSDRNLRRLAARAMLGIGRSGSCMANGSGDYVVAFSTAAEVRRPWNGARIATRELANRELDPLFQCAVEATEEAVYNALFQATSLEGNGVSGQAIPLDEVGRLLAAAGIVGGSSFHATG